MVDEDGDLVGMLTRAEILTAAHSPESPPTVRDLMKTDFPTVSTADSSRTAPASCGRAASGAVPVVDGGNLVGMLTIEDFGNVSLIRGLTRT